VNIPISIPFLFCFSSFVLQAVTPPEWLLWPDGAPGTAGVVTFELEVVDRSSDPAMQDRSIRHIQEPKLEIFAPDTPNGTAVVICPGGGYRYLSYDHEGVVIARRLNEVGITAFVLSYRLPGEGHANGTWVPLQDAQRALRTVRHHAKQWSLATDRIGVMGFSAGGHLASTLGTQYDTHCYEPVDSIDETSARPDFMILIYPVISMDATVSHMGSRDNLLGKTPPYSSIKQFSSHLQVDENTPPTFMALASDDGAVIPENSLGFIRELLRVGVPVEFHSFETGGHGFGIRRASGPTTAWPDLLLAWMQHRGY
jgi:acetyl esterase/lipase